MCIIAGFNDVYGCKARNMILICFSASGWDMEVSSTRQTQCEKGGVLWEFVLLIFLSRRYCQHASEEWHGRNGPGVSRVLGKCMQCKLGGGVDDLKQF